MYVDRLQGRSKRFWGLTFPHTDFTIYKENYKYCCTDNQDNKYSKVEMRLICHTIIIVML